MANTNGYQGQVRAIDQSGGCFSAGQEIMDLIEAQCNNYYTGTISRLGVQAPQASVFLINGKAVRMGQTGIYEVNNVAIYSLVFQADSSPAAIVDYII